MIQSNSVKVRNLVSKKEVFKGVLNSRVTTTIKSNEYLYAIFNIQIKEKGAGQIIAYDKAKLWEDTTNPIVYNRYGDKVSNILQAPYLNSKNNFFVVELGGRSEFELILNSSANNTSDVVINYTLSNYLPFFDKKDVLFEGKDYVFEKTTEITDSFNGLIVRAKDFFIEVFEDEFGKNYRSYSLSGIINREIQKVSIIPFDDRKVNTMSKQRIVVSTGNKIYYSHADGVTESKFAESKFWDLRDTVRKIPVKTIGAAGGNKRYDPTLPDSIYPMFNSEKVESGKTFIAYQGGLSMYYLGEMARTKKSTMWGFYTGSSNRVSAFMTTDGGANFVAITDFLNSQVTNSYSINTSSFSDYTAGLEIKKVTIQQPSEEVNDPTDPCTYTDVAFQSIVKGSATIVNAAVHGLKNGDIVLFTGNAQDDDWKSICCDSFDSKGFKQNVYAVKVIDANNFNIVSYNGSYDNLLYCRHIHSVNETVGGFIISTGEEYPNGWFMYVNQKLKDASTVVDAFNFPKSEVFRLNSSKKGIQRACGFLMDNENDPNIIFNADTSSMDLGRFKVGDRVMPRRPSNGIWKGKLSDVDNWDKFECIMPIPEPAIWMFQQGQVIVGYYQLGGNSVSVDGGKTWDYFPRGTELINGLIDNNIVIGNGYKFKWKK